MKKKIIKAYAVIVPGTGMPFTDLSLDEKATFGASRRFIISEKKSNAIGMLKINGLLDKKHNNFGFKIVPVIISY